MSKNVLILSSSARKGGNSDMLCDQFMKGAKEAGNGVDKIVLNQKEIHHCLGCGVCKRINGSCVQRDDMKEILDKMVAADVIVVATPVYFFSMSGLLKITLDRTYARFQEMRKKVYYLILTGASPSQEYMDTAVAGLRGYFKCLPVAREGGIIYGVEVNERGAVKDTPAMDEAYEMGRRV